MIVLKKSGRLHKSFYYSFRVILIASYQMDMDDFKPVTAGSI